MQTRASQVDGQDAVTRSLGDTLMACARGYEQLDAVLVARLFAEDGQWVDTAGNRLHGRAQIQAHLDQLFAQGWLPGDARNVAATISARLLRSDLALASVFTEGQRKRGFALGGRPKLRSVHRLQVLSRREQGWQVTTEVMLDEWHPRASAPAPILGIWPILVLMGLAIAMLSTPGPQHDRKPSIWDAALAGEALAAQPIDAGPDPAPPWTGKLAPAAGYAPPAQPRPSAEAQALADSLLDLRLSRQIEAQLPDFGTPVSPAVPTTPGCDEQTPAGWVLCFTR